LSEITYIVGIIAATMTLGGLSWQWGRMIGSHDTKAVTYIMMVWLCMAMILYFVFGFFYLHEPIVWIANAIGVVIMIGMVITKKYFELPPKHISKDGKSCRGLIVASAMVGCDPYYCGSCNTRFRNFQGSWIYHD